MNTKYGVFSTVKALRVLCLLLCVSSLLGYLEYGEGQHYFLIQVESEIVAKLFTRPKEVLHPLILLPLAGQLALLWSAVQNTPNSMVILCGILFLAILMIFLLFVGCLGLNFKIAGSTIPFIIFAVLTLWTMRAIRRAQ